MLQRSDEELMLAAGTGDRGAYATLVERHHRALVRFIDRFLGVGHPAAVDDIAQEVFLRAWKAAPAFQPRAKARTWLYRIATNACRNHLRYSKLRRFISLSAKHPLDLKAHEYAEPEFTVWARERAEQVQLAIAALPANQRAAILLRHFEGLTAAEIADALDASVSAVESLLFRARRTLQGTLGGLVAEEPPQGLQGDRCLMKVDGSAEP